MHSIALATNARIAFSFARLRARGWTFKSRARPQKSIPVPALWWCDAFTLALRYGQIGYVKDRSRRLCAEGFGIPGLDDWCPATLQELGQLTNYYNQITFSEAVRRGFEVRGAPLCAGAR